MATYIVKTTELRQKAAIIVQGLRAGDSFIIQHYRSYVGYISSYVPKDILKKIDAPDDEDGFRVIE